MSGDGETRTCGCRYPAKGWNLKVIASVVTAALVMLGFLGGLYTKISALAAARAEEQVTIEQHGSCLEDHENRIRLQEKLTAEIAGDVKFIRGRLEGRGPSAPWAPARDP